MTNKNFILTEFENVPVGASLFSLTGHYRGSSNVYYYGTKLSDGSVSVEMTWTPGVFYQVHSSPKSLALYDPESVPTPQQFDESQPGF